MTRVIGWMVRHRMGRFLIDVWFDPVRAWRDLTRKRTWPSPEEFARMTSEEFAAYLDWIGARRGGGAKP